MGKSAKKFNSLNDDFSKRQSTSAKPKQEKKKEKYRNYYDLIGSEQD
jgi:hypothetical protein